MLRWVVLMLVRICRWLLLFLSLVIFCCLLIKDSFENIFRNDILLMIVWVLSWISRHDTSIFPVKKRICDVSESHLLGPLKLNNFILILILFILIIIEYFFINFFNDVIIIPQIIKSRILNQQWNMFGTVYLYLWVLVKLEEILFQISQRLVTCYSLLMQFGVYPNIRYQIQQLSPNVIFV